MAHSAPLRVVETMPSGTWNDFTDLPAEFISQFSISSNGLSPTKCFHTASFLSFASATDDILIAACLVATFINLLVVACSFKLFNQKGDTLHLFILNMTIGDTILTLLCHPYELLARRYTNIQIHSLTVFLNFANWVGLAVSGLSLTLLNIDKLIFFCWPFKYDIWMSYFRAKMFCYLTWIISIGFATYYWMYSYIYFINTKVHYKQRFEIQFIFLSVFVNEGQLSPINRFFYEAFTVIFCVVPIVSSLMVSCYLYHLTRSKRRLEIRATLPAKSEKKATSFAFIFATTLWTSCSLLPYRLANLARIHVITWPNLDCDARQMMSWVTWILLYMLILNPIINPVITGFAYAPYRQLISSILLKTGKWGSKGYASGIFFKSSHNKKKAMCSANGNQKVHSIEMKEKHQNEILPVTPKAPLAKFPSRCSCGSLTTSVDVKCIRF